MKLFFTLIGVENNHPVVRSTDCSFFLLIQRAALLGLKDAGRLTEMQHRHAEEALLQQYRERIRTSAIEVTSDD